MSLELFEQLDTKIKGGEKVSAAQVADAYKQTWEKHLKEFEAAGGKAAEFEENEKTALDSYKDNCQQLLEKLATASQKLEKDKLVVVANADDAQRKLKYEMARKLGWEKTDPSNPYDKWLDDFEGTGETDKLGFGRSALSGYTSGLYMIDPNLARAAMEEAKVLFKAHSVDEYLSDDDVRKLMGPEFFQPLGDHNLTTRAQAFFAAFLRVGEMQLTGDEKDLYKKYVIDGIDNGLGKLPNKSAAPAGENLQGQNERSVQQLDALGGILTPMEWKKIHAREAGVQGVQQHYKTMCETISAAFGNTDFTLDAVITGLQNEHDEQKFVAAMEKARGDIYRYMKGKKNVFSSGIDGNKKTVAALMERNKVLKTSVVSDADWKNLDAAMQLQHVDLDSAGFVEKSSVEDLTAMWKVMAGVRDGIAATKSQLESLEKKIADAEKAEGAPIETPPEPTDKAREQGPELKRFLDEKNLKESYDSQTKQYSYKMGEPDFSSMYTEAGPDFKNPEVRKFVMNKLSPFFVDYLTKYAITPDVVRGIEEILAKYDKKDVNALTQALREVSIFVFQSIEKKIEDGQFPHFQKIRTMMVQAQKDSVLTFDHRPTAAELKSAYAEKFVKVWEKAERDFDAIIAEGVATVPKPEPAPVRPPTLGSTLTVAPTFNAPASLESAATEKSHLDAIRDTMNNQNYTQLVALVQTGKIKNLNDFCQEFDAAVKLAAAGRVLPDGQWYDLKVMDCDFRIYYVNGKCEHVTAPGDGYSRLAEKVTTMLNLPKLG